MDTFIFQIMTGFATGSIYASVALALVIIFRSTHELNLAQGEMAMFSTFVAWQLIEFNVPYWGAFAITLVFSFFAGMLIERILVRPAQNGNPLTAVAIFVGLMLIINGMAGWIFGFTMRDFPSPFENLFTGLPVALSGHEIGMLAVVFTMLLLIFLFFRFTPLGLALRAVAVNPESCRLVGISVNRMLAIGWGLAAMIGSVAGMMAAPILFLDPHMMAFIMTYGLAAAVLGGLDSPLGAIIAGLLLGVMENLAGAYVVGPELKLPLALLVIFSVLVFRPRGLMGHVVIKRV